MAANRVSLLLLTFAILVAYAQKIPSAITIQALKPKGFRAYVPDQNGMGIFAFQANINKGIGQNDVGGVGGEVLNPTHGKWVFENLDVELKKGDIINYYYFVSVNEKGYLYDNLTYTVQDFVDSAAPLDDPATSTTSPCQPTVTSYRGGHACAGALIFEENFDTIRDDYWQIEQYIALGKNPEYPFVSYQRLPDDPPVYVTDGVLHIRPQLQQHLPGYDANSMYSGELNLYSGCTGVASMCKMRATGASILPPIASGRITSKGFVFTYGTVEIRAKLPQGDWLYPEILLEPFLSKYGEMSYASGVLKIAAARGNRRLTHGTTDYGNSVLYGGAIIDSSCRNVLLRTKVLDQGRAWGDDFHVYSLTWTPDRITLSVDNEEWMRVEPTASGLKGHLPSHCQFSPRDLLKAPIAPFDTDFQISLGVSAGGDTEFPDGAVSGRRAKPWRDRSPKAALNFWRDISAWHPTWTQPELLVDYVKVYAL